MVGRLIEGGVEVTLHEGLLELWRSAHLLLWVQARGFCGQRSGLIRLTEDADINIFGLLFTTYDLSMLLNFQSFMISSLKLFTKKGFHTHARNDTLKPSMFLFLQFREYFAFL